MTKAQMHQEITRLQSENRVLRQLIKETQKALANIDNFTDLTILDTVSTPFTSSIDLIVFMPARKKEQ
jgi:hypothetical protein